MKKIMFSAVAIAAIISANAQPPKMPPAKAVATTKVNPTAKMPAFKNAVDSFSYAIGMSVGESLKQAGAVKINTQIIAKAMGDVYGNAKMAFNKELSNAIIQETLQGFGKKKAEAQKAVCSNFLAENMKKAGVSVLPDGMQYEILKAGDPAGQKPKPIDTVVVNYAGTLMDGTEFDNSYKRGAPAEFPVSGVIRGWTEILQMMTKGAKWKVYIPSELAYGENPPSPQIPPNSLLIFEISLEDIKPATTVGQ